MKESGKPRLGDPRIGREQARRCIDAYISAWNEPDTERRAQILDQVITDDGAYDDPTKKTAGRADISAYIGEVQARYPGGRIVRTSAVDAHHFACRFNWCVVKADGTQLPESVDFVVFAWDGRVRRVTGFFGAMEEIPI